MTTSARYLESAKVEQLAGQFRREGYEVIVEPSGPDRGYDLVATKPGKRIAVEVKANSQLGSSSHQIKELRRRAFEQGFDEFRLVVVNPPHETRVQIEGLERKLASYISNYQPTDLTAISDKVTVKATKGIEIDSISALPGSTRVIGHGVVSIEIPFSHGPVGSAIASMADEGVEPGYSAGSPILNDEDEWVGWDVDLPFSFDLELDRELEIVRAYSLAVDARSLFD